MNPGTRAKTAVATLEGGERQHLLLFPGVLLLLTLTLSVLLLSGCSGRSSQGPFKTEVTYAIPDDFRLAMARFERRLEAHDIEGVLRTFDSALVPDYRLLERTFLAFARRTDAIAFDWKVRDVREGDGYRALEVPWTMSFDDVLHGHRVERHGVTQFLWSRHVVPRLIGLERDALFPVVSP